MGVYAYTAVDSTDRVLSGTLIADTPAAGRHRLRDQGFKVVAFVPARSSNAARSFSCRSRVRRQQQVAEMARSLSLLLRSGVPLAEAVDVLTAECAGPFATVLKDLRDRVTGGASLADALSAHPDWFSELFRSAARVGELSGQLDECLQELAEHLRARQSLRNELVGALTYPLILVCVAAAVVVFLMTRVVPELLGTLAAAGRSLPLSTRALKAVSDVMVQRWPVVLALAFGVITFAAMLHRIERCRRALHGQLLRAPILGPLIRKTLVAHVAQHLEVMLRTGIPFVDAVRGVAGCVRHPILVDELLAIASAVESGSDVAPTLRHSRVFPPVVAHLVAVGQDSGELPLMLSDIRRQYEGEVRLATKRLTTALEPLLIVLLAGVVGFVILACLVPILELAKGIG